MHLVFVEALLCLFFDFSVGHDPIKKLSTVTGVFCHSSLISFKSFVMHRFLF